MACDLKTILSSACANDFVQVAATDPKLARAVILQLLCNISAGGGTGGTQQLFSTADLNPNTAGVLPTDQTKGAQWYQDPAVGTGTNVWYWSTSTKTWIQFSV
jgi:hypothetical protein